MLTPSLGASAANCAMTDVHERTECSYAEHGLRSGDGSVGAFRLDAERGRDARLYVAAVRSEQGLVVETGLWPSKRRTVRPVSSPGQCRERVVGRGVSLTLIYPARPRVALYLAYPVG